MLAMLSFFDEAVAEYEALHRHKVEGTCYFKQLPDNACVEVLIEDLLHPMIRESGLPSVRSDRLVLRSLAHELGPETNNSFTINLSASPVIFSLVIYESLIFKKMVDFVRTLADELKSVYIWKGLGYWKNPKTGLKESFVIPKMVCVEHDGNLIAIPRR